MTVADEVRQLAEMHGVTLTRDYASYLATHVSRIAGIEGDDILNMVIELGRREIITEAEVFSIVDRYSDEIAGNPST
ncbi:hypothetical protein GFM44_23285 [Rhizobium leguminosarum bv. viciae]|nr:hypothetical protein [Rhizobium leguminosarum bv. viciae]